MLHVGAGMPQAGTGTTGRGLRRPICRLFASCEHSASTSSFLPLASSLPSPSLQVPLHTSIQERSDHGTPVVVADPQSELAGAYVSIAQRVYDKLQQQRQGGQGQAGAGGAGGATGGPKITIE